MGHKRGRMSEFSGGVGDGGGFDSGGFMDGTVADAGQATGSPLTSSGAGSIKGVKLSDMLQGINVTPNFMLAMLFLGFTAWLFVIYWIRHNEPLANQVLGTPQAVAPTAYQDQQIVKGLKHALPIRTSDRTGNFFTPEAKLRKQQSQHQSQASFHQSVVMPNKRAYGNGQHALHYAPPGAGHARVLKSGREHVLVPHPEPMVMAPGVHRRPMATMQNAYPTRSIPNYAKRYIWPKHPWKPLSHADQFSRWPQTQDCSAQIVFQIHMKLRIN